jgi:hypothetical protein
MPESPNHVREIPPDDGPEALIETLRDAIDALTNLKRELYDGGDAVSLAIASNVLILISERKEGGFEVDTFAYGNADNWEPLLISFAEDIGEKLEDIDAGR